MVAVVVFEFSVNALPAPC
ncbi:hypothetical protein VC116059_003151A, partial [Vibrio cholerae O1 str. 116059]